MAEENSLVPVEGDFPDFAAALFPANSAAAALQSIHMVLFDVPVVCYMKDFRGTADVEMYLFPDCNESKAAPDMDGNKDDGTCLHTPFARIYL